MAKDFASVNEEMQAFYSLGRMASLECNDMMEACRQGAL